MPVLHAFTLEYKVLFLDIKDKIDYFLSLMTSDTHSQENSVQEITRQTPSNISARHGTGKKFFASSDKALIKLAVKCRLITPDREMILLDQLAQKKKKNYDYTAEQLLSETQSLTHNDISFLFAVKDHLEMKMLDKKFGELGVASKFIQPESVKKALNIQSDIFKETSRSKLIGDILLENREITIADKAAILLTQDRIQDELLFDTLNDIAESEIEKLSVNMRFGAIAVKKEYITIDQLNQALEVQKSGVEKKGGQGQYLGQILKDLFNLPDQALTHILKIQKEMEKKRLSLEQTLETYNSETSINKRLAKLFEYRFEKNKLSAHLIQIKQSFEDIRVPDLKRWLTTIGITQGICPDDEITLFLDQNIPGSEICIASGRKPEPGTDGRVEFYFDTNYRAGDNKGDPGLLPLVKKGDALARLIPEKKGKPGRGINGFSLPPPKPEPTVLNCGDGVIRKKDFFIAEDDGVALLIKDRTLFVKACEQSTPTYHYTGSIDMDLGEEYKNVNLKVDGSILENGRVRCLGLQVSGDILGQVSAAGDIMVKGNIGREAAPLELGPIITGPSEFVPPEIEPAQLKAEGDILPGKSIFNAIIITGKSMVAPNADLTATAVQAYQDITVKNILHNGSRPCVLQTGKVPGLKADSINTLIKGRIKTLDQLRCGKETRELEAWFKEKTETKDGYLYEHHYLKYILALICCIPLSALASLPDKLLAARNTPEKYPDLPEKPAADNQKSKDFERELIEETNAMPPKILESYIREQADIKYGMYRAAVNAGRRHNHKYETHKKIILEKIEARKAEIKELETAVKKLTIQKDRFLLSQAHQYQPIPPAIRVKNRTAKGTVIKGKKAILTIDQDMYGVKFTETDGTATDPIQILIQGFYD